jgi:hypothetical protein
MIKTTSNNIAIVSQPTSHDEINKDKFQGYIAQAVKTNINKPTCQVDIYTKTTTRDVLAPVSALPWDKNKKQMQIKYLTTVTSIVTPKKANGQIDPQAFIRLNYEINWPINVGKDIVKSETGRGITQIEKTFTRMSSKYSDQNPIIREDIYDNRVFYNGGDTALYFRDFVSNVDAQCIIEGKDVKPTYNTPENILKNTKMKR